MREGFRVGRIFGIAITIDWSWLLIFSLITWNLGTGFSALHPDWEPLLSWGLGIVAALLLFASVLIHELAHSLISKAQGVPVRSITLHLFGGVSNIQREPDSPGSEFLMAILGPISSLVIGIGLLALAGLLVGLGAALRNPTQALESSGPLLTLVLWLGSVNVSLGIFNLIPGFPLDGGRVLRSILWALTNNLRRATRWASWMGQAIAWTMILAGIAMTFGMRIPYFGTGLGSGLWLAFIGWFLNSASVQSYRQVLIEDVLQGTPVMHMMRRDPPTCSANCSVSRLVHDHIMQSDDQAFPIVEASQLIGLVTLSDVRGVSREDWDTTRVLQIMTSVDDLITVSPDEDAAEALNKLNSRDLRQLPVVRDGELVGLLRRRDIIKWLQLRSELSV